jgi:ferritin-like metal-binding protein YciE
MPIKDPKELFVQLLSNLRHNTEKANRIYEEIGKVAEDPEVKEALEARAFVSEQILAKFDRCFKLISEKPVKADSRLHDVFMEDFRKELGMIESPAIKKLFVLAKLRHLAHLRIGEYIALIEAADFAGHQGLGVLLETCLADKLAFAERTRRLLRRVAEVKVAERVAVATAR